jgi:hypothetical protein
MALESRVFPTPGAPLSKTPLCSFAPLAVYSSGFLIILIKLSISSLISSMPLTLSSLSLQSLASLISNLDSSLATVFCDQLSIKIHKKYMKANYKPRPNSSSNQLAKYCSIFLSDLESRLVWGLFKWYKSSSNDWPLGP